MLSSKACKYVVASISLYVGVTAAFQCIATDAKPLRLSINSRRNNTGHWIAQVTLEHGAGRMDTGAYTVDVDHTTSSCQDEGSVLLVTTLTAPPRQHIASDYEFLPGLGYYKYHSTVQPWYKATQTCAGEGGHMLILNSDKEFEAIKKIWDKEDSSASLLHIGINDFDKEEEYVTIFDEPLNTTGYVKWASGEPTKDATWNCGRLRRDGYFEDSFCPHKYPFFCERSV
ncbi:hemolymph lipopolysaccharide-binding protein-like [Periplaneta americana]|uniref:hemolymph lipopolysaccharide-binding protein-like n=1 Tax=Periplaneta americana TaxID=6978 RepID=UPI0037E91F65